MAVPCRLRLTVTPRARRAVALFTGAILAISGCSGGGEGGSPANPGDQPGEPGVARSRQWIEDNPLPPDVQEVLDDCLEGRIGRRDLGAEGSPSVDDLEAYEGCAEELGVLDRVLVVEEGPDLDVDAASRELAHEAECLQSRGWEAVPEDPDDRGVVFWRYPAIEDGDRGQLEEWNDDRRSCGVDVPTGPGTDEEDDHAHHDDR